MPNRNGCSDTSREKEFIMWNVECGMWNVECGTWNVERGMWNVECGMWNGPSDEERLNAECGSFIRPQIALRNTDAMRAAYQ